MPGYFTISWHANTLSMDGTMKIKLHKFLDNYLEEIVLFPGLVFIVLALGIEVFRRYVLNSPGAYTSELATFAFVWIVYIGVPYGVKKQKHITLDLLPENLNYMVDKILIIISLSIQMIFFGFMAIQTLNLIQFNKLVNMVSDAMSAPLWIVLICFPVGFGLAIFRLLQIFLQVLKRGEK